MPANLATNSLPTSQQNAPPADPTGNKRNTNRRKRPRKHTKNPNPFPKLTNQADRESTEGEPNDAQTAAPPPPAPETTKGEKKRRTEQNEGTPTPTLPSTPIFDPQLPPSHATTPSFLNDNLQAYITSPSPHPGTNTPKFYNIDLEALLDNTDVDMPSAGDVDMSLVGSDQEPPSAITSSLRERLLAAREHRNKVNTHTNVTKDPIEKYTPQPVKKPEIHYSHPTAAFDNIDIDQVCSWENRPGGKLLAHPFGHEV
jgi:hypothetical protein